ncbi:pirin family protein [Alteromonas mediterranea]|uniref:Pirin n=1 Tax=Alteromonas mediterranea TaxID=314275 RepID=A0AAC8XKA8_9ALTE|nr:pirin family protein [Alteromonas mediterranea]MDY6884211.1 pirin family protein [Pseudomonadota bacterium]AFV85559.1 Pirin-like protein [Alteromonas mediterranea DE1]AGP81855.1 pirin-like protein [Alteromonas mediterranea MED64]AGP97571.1 pirin-like protein [Alteromonas mediterranea UM7]AGQ01824.1 pirin-like protein [Alteromonas mediterranea UM4b]|tara:strand:- start:346 stop:1209 length:864 start_codon:yes stop_codon:yes gene_type:complete
MSFTVNAQKTIEKVVTGMPTSDGAGVSLTRIIGQPDLPRLDPFLMLDFFGSDNPGEYIAGFPPHPHRGFQTVTYMLAGKMRHKDSVGNEGVIDAGGIQWMNAGRGIIHEEMPEQEEGLLQGFQLWVNLPAIEKMSAPNYQDIQPDSVPMAHIQNADVKVLAGAIEGVQGPVKTTAVSPTFLDVALKSGPSEIAMNSDESAFIYVYEGDVVINKGEQGNETILEQGELGVLSQKGTQLCVSTDTECKFIVVSGKPINEPVVQYGPFVMNSQQEIVQAFNDYQSGVLAK